MADCWRLFGLTVSSEIPLPGATVEICHAPDVSVRLGRLPAIGTGLSVLPGSHLQMEVPNVGRYRISGGRDIVVDSAPEASLRNLRVYLLGSAMGALLHQRALLPLHANAIVINELAVAFMGPSGSGKSTLAAWFQKRGFPLLADDVLAVSTAGTPTAMPGVPRLRLWDDALRMVDPPGGPFEPSFDDQSKFDVPILSPAGPTPLHACYLLEDEQGSTTAIHALDGVGALEALMANTYRGRFVSLIGKAVEHAQQCIRLTRQTTVFRVARPKDPRLFEEVGATILDHAERSILQASLRRAG